MKARIVPRNPNIHCGGHHAAWLGKDTLQVTISEPGKFSETVIISTKDIQNLQTLLAAALDNRAEAK